MGIAEDIRNGESYTLEFKRTPNEDRAKYLKTAVAFANGKGGQILFGVANDSEIVGIPSDTVLSEMDAITNAVIDSCSPRLPVNCGIVSIDGKSIILLEILPGTQCPYYLNAEGDKDGVYVRVGATTRRADDATRCELTLESQGRFFDSEPCLKATVDASKIESLCDQMYRIACENSKTEELRKSVRKVTEDQLFSWGILTKRGDDVIGTNAYALLTGDAAFSTRVKCGVFKGKTRAIFVDRREFTGSVMDLLEESYKYVLGKINLGCTFEGLYRQDVYEIPPDAIRELLTNAFVHRLYIDHDAPIFVAVYDNRVEITSPGGLPRGTTVEQVVAGYSRTRNKALAHAFNYMNLIEEWGSGIPRVNEFLSQYALQDVLISNQGNFLQLSISREKASCNYADYNPAAQPVAFVREGGVYDYGEAIGHNSQLQYGSEKTQFGSEKTGLSSEKQGFSSEKAQSGSEKTPSSSEKTQIGSEKTGFGSEKTWQKILLFMESDNRITIAELSERLGISGRAVSKQLHNLQSRKLLRRVGPDKGGYWEVLAGA